MSKKVEWDYIVDVKMPLALKNVEPGKLHPSLLRDIPGGGKLFYLAAHAWLAMVDAAKADGVELKPTSAGDTYRTYDSQLVGFKQRYQLQEIPGASTRTFEGKKWYLKKGMAPLAAPGSSKHNLGIAVDVANAADSKRIKWLIANVEKFGWSWEVVPEEPWHLRYVAGDNVPEAVKAWVTANNVQTPSSFGTIAEQKATVAQKAAAPAANTTAAAGKPELTKDNKGAAVKEAQTLLSKHGFACKPDGSFGPKTEELVKNFQKAKSIPVTGRVDQATWAALLA